MEKTKQCGCCKEIKKLSDFYQDKKGKFGRRYECKKCGKKNNLDMYANYKDKYGLGSGTIKRYGFKLSLEVYERAGRKCEECGEINDLTIHHLDRNGVNNQFNHLPMNNHKDNLVILCRSCHGRLHSIQRWAGHKRKD